MENEKKNGKLQFYYRFLTSTHSNIVLYKSFIRYRHKTNLIVCDYLRAQYCAFRNKLGTLI